MEKEPHFVPPTCERCVPLATRSLHRTNRSTRARVRVALLLPIAASCLALWTTPRPRQTHDLALFLTAVVDGLAKFRSFVSPVMYLKHPRPVGWKFCGTLLENGNWTCHCWFHLHRFFSRSRGISLDTLPLGRSDQTGEPPLKHDPLSTLGNSPIQTSVLGT